MEFVLPIMFKGEDQILLLCTTTAAGLLLCVVLIWWANGRAIKKKTVSPKVQKEMDEVEQLEAENKQLQELAARKEIEAKRNQELKAQVDVSPPCDDAAYSPYCYDSVKSDSFIQLGC